MKEKPAVLGHLKKDFRTIVCVRLNNTASDKIHVFIHDDVPNPDQIEAHVSTLRKAYSDLGWNINSIEVLATVENFYRVKPEPVSAEENEIR
ncbi:MAG: hypothetical protein D6698_13985 [Gammaproteobacteria bacterium]|nr:MAG: hypothetical protein D6698_13985 [Gammaproteobacteria bacterium]